MCSDGRLEEEGEEEEEEEEEDDDKKQGEEELIASEYTTPSQLTSRHPVTDRWAEPINVRLPTRLFRQ